jgi:hypothetical protein
MGLWQYKYAQVGPGQRANTRARTMINRFRDKINRCANRYRAARAALLKLDPNGDWTARLLELKPSDVRGPGREDDDEDGISAVDVAGRMKVNVRVRAGVNYLGYG